MPDAPSPPSPKAPREPPGAHLPDLDLLRIVAMGVVVLEHACVAYLQRPIAGLLWPVQEVAGGHWPRGESHWTADAIFWLSRCTGVPAITFIAGLFAARALIRHGPRKFLHERARRLLFPLLIGIACVLPLMYVIWVWGWVTRGWAAWDHLLHVRFGPAIQPNLHGLGHLWYLQYLFLVAALYVGWHVLLAGRAPSRAMTSWLRSFAHARPLGRALLACGGVLALASCVGMLTYVVPDLLLAFTNGFIPQPAKFAWIVLWFAAGVLTHHATHTGDGQPGGMALRSLTSLWPGALVLAGVAAWLLVDAAIQWKGAQTPQSLRMQFALGSGVFSACMLVVLVGCCSRVAARLPIGMLAHLAGATYWVYFTHLIFQGVSVVLLYRQPLAIEAKIALVFIAGLGGSLLTFSLVRTTRIGHLLGAR